MSNRISVLAVALLSPLCLSPLLSPLCLSQAQARGPGWEPGRSPGGELGRIKFLACHGATFFDGFTPEEIDGGAYSVWCYDASGERVARLDHGPVFAPVVEATYTHYDDRNDDGVLSPWEVNGTLSVGYVPLDPRGLPQRVAIDESGQAVVALEVASSQIISKRGWFARTEQLINRNNVVVEQELIPDDDDADDQPQLLIHVVHVNFAVYSFLERAATMSP
ncbi:MAG: hypothetical protein IT385_06155 [Deltaproteobacteria bacterium]|nr:hypothetical protein [Deltaproteobacteria bacterium]